MSADSDFCVCCDLLLSSCGLQAERRERRAADIEREVLLERRDWFESAHPGRCASCRDGFAAGTAITRHGGGYKAACCA